jgi:hypothetical protein
MVVLLGVDKAVVEELQFDVGRDQTKKILAISRFGRASPSSRSHGQADAVTC